MFWFERLTVDYLLNTRVTFDSNVGDLSALSMGSEIL